MRGFPGIAAFILFAAAIVAPISATAAEVELSARLDTHTVYEGESFTLIVTVDGPMRGIESPDVSALEDFALLGTSSSSSFSFVNGKASGSKTFKYTLIPQVSGSLEIPAIPVIVKGRKYFTKPIAVRAQPASGGGRTQARGRQADRPGQPTAARDDGEGNRQVFIRSWTDKQRSYVGEQITHHFALYRNPRARFLGTPQYTPPELTGFWAEPLGDEISGYRKIEGRDYATTELRTALYPSEPGSLSIGPASVRVRLRSSSSWDLFSFDSGPDKVLRSPPVAVEVLPLPEAGKPAGFQGTVARDLRLATRIDPGPYEAGQPVTLLIELSGVGNPRAFAEPRLDPGEDFKLYESDLKSETEVDEEQIRVRKRFSRVVVPRREGSLTLPGVSYAWFDPASGRYRTARTRDISLTVAPSSSEETEPVVFTDLNPERVALLGQAIHHIKTGPLLAGDGRRFPRSGSFWTFLLLPWPLLLGAWFWRARRERLLADEAGFRARGARRLASRRLRRAERARDDGDFDRFCAELAGGLRGYLADRLDVSAAGLTSDQVETGLSEVAVSSALRERTRALLSDCDFARYAPGSEHSTRMAELYTRATDLIGELESAIGKGGRRPRLAQTILPLLLALTIGAGTLLATRGVSAQDLGGENAVATAEAAAGGEASQRVRATIDPAAGMEEAATRYENGDFAGAAAVWRELAGAGVEDSRLWYNLGNAHFQGGEMGRAILAYRRAQRLAPRDREIRDNLALARSRRGDGTLSPEPSFWGRAWGWLRATFSPGELAVFGLALLWLATLLTLLLILKRAGWRRLRWMLVPVLVFLPLISAAAWVAEWQDWSGSEAVLLAPSVAVQSGPGADYITLFEIHEGAELRVRERRGGWLRVDLGEQLEGWIPAVAAETL